MPLVGRDPYDIGDTLFLLGNSLRMTADGMERKPSGLLKVPPSVEIEDMVGFERASGRVTLGLSFYASFFKGFAEGRLKQSFTRFNLTFGEIPTTIASYEKHVAAVIDHDASGSTNPAHTVFEAPQDADRNTEGAILVAEFHN